MSFLTKPTLFLGEGVYIDSNMKDMHFLRYGLWIPINNMGTREVIKIKSFLKDTFPEEYDEYKDFIA